MINNDKIFSSENYNFDNEQSQEGFGKMVAISLLKNPFVLLGIIILLGYGAVKFLNACDKLKIKRLYAKNKNKVDKIVEKLKTEVSFEKCKVNIFETIKKVTSSQKIEDMYISSLYFDNKIKDRAISIGNDDDFIKEIIIPCVLENIKNVNTECVFTISFDINRKCDIDKDMDNIGDDKNPCHVHKQSYLDKLEKTITDSVKNTLPNIYKIEKTKCEDNPDNCYEEFKNGILPVESEIFIKFDTKQLLNYT